MLPKENLPQIEVCDVQGRMYPCDVKEWALFFFNVKLAEFSKKRLSILINFCIFVELNII